MDQKPDPDPNDQPAFRPWVILAVVLAMLFLVPLFEAAITPEETVSYSEIKRQIADGQIQSVVLTETDLTAQPVSGDVPVQGDPALMPLLDAYDVEVTAKPPGGGSILGALLPWIFLGALFYFMTRRLLGSTGLPGQGLGNVTPLRKASRNGNGSVGR